ncbi:MBG domain-containing protein [Pseudoflavitalea rhizosphaerae]|uniref:MBG domain-containing protein n=1 Tax=Pseudoflavitalea rhizosphaerae TaxID=1884793 RepID=UPI000F8D62AE|nr:MBG domain-containing protein [Pseudoflavitalea rhizosphaerae]
MLRTLRPVLLCIALLFFIPALKAQVDVSSTTGTTFASYANLKTAFDAVNAGTHQGVITIAIRGNTTEPGTATLNASGAGAASYSNVFISPGPGVDPVISGTVSSGPVVRLNGSNNVTIDGSNNFTDSRNLTITNTGVSAPYVLQIGSAGTTPVSNVTVKNSILINGANTSSAVMVGDAGVMGNPGYFNNITLQNNNIRKAFIGIYIYAVVAAGNGNVLVDRNDLNSTGTDAIRMVGVYGQGANGLVIRNNNIGNFESGNVEFDRAIWLATATTNAEISNNTITGLSYSGTSSYAPIGINISPGVANSNIDVTGNTISNLSSNGTYMPIGIFLYSAMSGATISNNKVSNLKNRNTSGYGAAGIALQATITAANVQVQNNFVWDIAGYGYNGYEANDNGNGIVIDGGGGYDINFNTVVLNTNQTLTGGHRASCLLVTQNVITAGAVGLRNNIFANLQTVGNASSRLAISNLSTDGSGVFSAIDHNVYFSTSTNLSSTGTNASITNTLAQLQTSLGGNTNSLNIQPEFVGANDLHLNREQNAAIDAKGTPIGGINTDIDGEARNAATPDPGADEFIPCPVITVDAQPQPVNICATANASFSISATNALTYQWQVDEGSGFADIANSVLYAGATTNSLTLTNVPAGNDGFIYRCIVTAGTGCNPVNSSPALLTVGTPVAISADPGNMTISHLDNTSFTVANTGTGPFTYQWQVDDGGGFTDLTNTGVYSTVNTAALTITGATVSMNGYQYRCAVSACGSATSNAATLTVNQLAQTLDFATQTNGGTVTVTYGDPAINGAASATSGLAVTYTSGNTAVADVNVSGQVTIIGAGTTTITVSQAGDAVYLPATNISFTVTVQPKEIIVNARSLTRIYGDSDPSFTYTVNTPLLGGDVFTGALDRDPGENTGMYQILQNTLTAGPNYNIIFNSNILTITPKELTVTADDKTRQYGVANPPLTLTYSGFAFADDASVLTTAPLAGTSAVPASWPGDYPITIAGGASSNYTFTFVPGKLTVEAILLNIEQQPINSMICADARATFNTAVTATPSIAPVSYQWQYSADGISGWSDLSQGSTDSYQTRAGSPSGFYRCRITVPGTDFYSQPAELTMYPLPRIRAAKSNDIDCAFTSAKLAASGGVSYQWSPAGSLDNANSPNPIATPDKTTTYLVTGTDGNGCSGSDRILVTYTPSEYNVPNAFTPNNDGKNDCFGVRHWQKVTDFSLSIFNRYGARIFHTTDLSKCWDGNINGVPQATGSFVYYIKGMAPCGLIERKGSLFLFR